MNNNYKVMIVSYLWNIHPERIHIKRRKVFLDGKRVGRVKGFYMDIRGIGMQYMPDEPIEKVVFEGTLINQ